jgi:hypothetical protein
MKVALTHAISMEKAWSHEFTLNICVALIFNFVNISVQLGVGFTPVKIMGEILNLVES